MPICKISDGDFFTQKLVVGEVAEHSWEYCKKLSVGKKVLHIGCSDYPIFNKESNMHLYLAAFAKELHGCDIDGIEQLKEHYNGIYFNDVRDADSEYDVILVPNVIEHLVNPGLMVKLLFEINFKQMFVLVPNYFISNQASYENRTFTEKIHPDHLAWYSPYTLYNLFKKPMENIGAECEINFFDNKNMISILIEKHMSQ